MIGILGSMVEHGSTVKHDQASAHAPTVKVCDISSVKC